MVRGSARISSAVLLLGLSALSLACDSASAESKPQEATHGAPGTPAPAPTVAPAAAASPSPAQQSYQEEAFELSLAGPTSGKVDDSLEFVVLLQAKAGYKVNAEYPIKFAFEVSDAVVPEVPVLKKEQGSIEKTKAELRGKLKVKKAGPQSIAGKLSFSVCTEERCLIEKRDLALLLTAS